MPTLPRQPSLNFPLLLLQRRPHRQFRHVAIGVGRSRRDVALMFQTLAQLLVGAAHMFSKDVPTRRFVLRKITPRPGCYVQLGRRTLRLGVALRRRLAGREEDQQQRHPGETVSPLKSMLHEIHSSANGKIALTILWPWPFPQVFHVEHFAPTFPVEHSAKVSHMNWERRRFGATILSMARNSVAGYLDNFLDRGRECAYVQRHGYRTVRWSHRQVAETSFQFARELHARGISKGDRVLLWGPNSAEWVAAFLGCALAGVVVVPMDDAATTDFALRVAQQVGAKLLVCSREHVQPSIPTLLFDDFSETLLRHSSAVFPVESGPNDALQIVFTSGTTAEPKGVVITHGNVLANVIPLESEIGNYLKYERFVHPIRFLNLLPLSHVFGQFLGMFLPQLMGGTVIFQDTLKPAEVIGTIKRERVSVLVAVPRMLQSLKEKIERDLENRNRLEKFRRRFKTAEGKHFLRRWWIFRRVHREFGFKFWAFISGGAALDADTEEFWGRLGFAVIQGYGLTETTSLISVNHPFRRGKGSIGKVLAGREVKLSPDGEILVRGGGVASGYWGGQDLTGVDGEEGWYKTGDVGELDADGNLYFKGRKKEVIVTPAGMNVYPDDLETALRRQPQVKDCVVVGLPRDGNAEPCAVLILREGSNNPEEIVKQANESLAEFQRMRVWLVWPEEDFPRTSTQKPRRNLILQAVQGQLANQPRAQGAASPLAELIRRVKGTSSEFSANANLDSDLNLSSLDRVELLSALEDRYQLDLSETRFAAVNTVGDLERMLQGKVPQRVQYHYPRWAERWPVTWIRIAVHYLLLRPSVFFLGWPRIEGRENLRDTQGPVLVVCNHIDDVDVGFVLTALPARLRHKLATAAGGEALEALRTPPPTKNVFARIFDRLEWAFGVALLNVFPLPRAAGFRESFAYAGESVDRGYSILVFPEGHHTTDGKLRPFRAGVGLLANNLGIPVVPMRIDGLFEVKKAGKKFAAPGKVRVRIGAPVQFSAESDPQWIANELQKRVQEL
jgi:long-chain acyl-CoA synthetase